MKKIVMTLVAAFAAMSMNAQNMYVGGSLGYSTTSYDGSTLDTKITLRPEFGYRFNEHMGVGVELGYGSDKDESASNLTVTTTSLTFAPYFRYTAIKLGNLSLFADGKFAYNSIKTENKTNQGNTTDSTTDGWGIYVQPGMVYSLNNKISIACKFGNALGYSSSKPDISGAKSTTRFQFLNLSNSISFGAYYNF